MSPRKSRSENDTLEMPPEQEEAVEYMVEEVLNARKRGGRREFLIKWAGYPVDEATWEAESDCDCEEAIETFLKKKEAEKAAPRKRESGVTNGKSASSAKKEVSKSARRATVEESMGIVTSARKRRRTVSKSQSETLPPKPERKTARRSTVGAPQQHSTPIKGGAKSTRSGDSASASLPKRLREVANTDLASNRATSYDSDEGSARVRFLRVKKPVGDADANSTTGSSSYSEEKVYKLQQGKEIEAILGVNKDGARLLYAVQYKGPEPKHQRIELVPSTILRSYAMEVFVDFLEQLVVASTTSNADM